MTQRHLASAKRGTPSYAKRAASAAVLAAALATGLGAAPGTTPQAFAAGDDFEHEVIKLHNGKDFTLPYKKMPTNTSFTGYPGLEGSDWKVGWKAAQAAFNPEGDPNEDPDQFVRDNLIWRADEQEPEFLQSDEPFRAIYRHKSVNEYVKKMGEGPFTTDADYSDPIIAASQFGKFVDSRFAKDCSRSDVSCVFVGRVTERAPIIGQSDNIQGPTEFTTTTSNTETRTRVKEQGWSVGGSVNVGYGQDTKAGEVTSKPSAGGSLNFSYTNKTTDTKQYANTQTSTYKRTVPQGYWGYEEVRAAAAKYTGFFLVHDKNSRVIDVMPVTTTVKAEGDVPPVTRSFVTTKDQNTPMMAEARKLQQEIAETRRQLGAAPGPQRKKLETSLEELTSRKEKLLRDSSAKVEVSKLEFG
ncbi:hypothetical protein [Streptomyces sp. NPDC037389]|uniref:hypothetical protein n=1 Tax=Streptomyces sp. NPDC037389 TaxID=3155369 RepID=UPI0033FFD1AE